MKFQTPAFQILFAVSVVFSLACETGSVDPSADQRELSLEHYPSGALRWKRTYVHGVKEGIHVGWWENGRKQFEYHFHNGQYDGDFQEWYPNGTPALLLHYENGKESGLQRAWRENGTLYANYEARDGKQYGIINSRLCYSVKDGKGVFRKAQ